VTEPVDLIIFDCDGVLVDSERLAIHVDVLLLERLGWPLTEAEVVERFVGRSDADMRAEVEAHLGRPIPPEVDAEFDEIYRSIYENELVAVDGIVEALDALEAVGVLTCVASSGGHAKIRRSLELTRLTRYFDDRIYSAMDVVRGKPAPDLFLFAAAGMGVSPSHAAVVEDSGFGVDAALAAGMRAFAYAGGVTPGARLARPGVVVFDEMRQLPGLLMTAGMRTRDRDGERRLS
jgi:HAD superfamily hydrolase (TIGR01509 family)